jgi:hypothetical protein
VDEEVRPPVGLAASIPLRGALAKLRGGEFGHFVARMPPPEQSAWAKVERSRSLPLPPDTVPFIKPRACAAPLLKNIAAIIGALFKRIQSGNEFY